ncbi:MAG: carbamoyl-phosphate synthase large subunit [Elusimicrobia bacterium]|jgi:carbamoyl-phosphate synthase large subunit|nr:carbamoyl-phosphate synthase large subunit [Elusimicrobiota bacterium]MBK7207914.1 carbamoyl-phosphate synthase large subunit [Elusimicrobiota bacterium]MBK7544677.1 carbamoyl-phosphate synthase large subunit [Elusimicrobiota bacterium]MBK7574210.1 carbamoyl-phosphate synthase large subunit [Elusimicrobiota bacterium]MBK7688850.1 carbamoyl-phosphate synthase large subunit [Elusimicrobiota bacterium]
MPKRTDIETILIIGSGPIVIGQACEFDYSGAQAVKALKKEGYRVVLINSNPATIMTDPEFAHATYVEPLIPSMIERILEKEKPQVILPTLGGQTALNLAVELHERGSLQKYGVELIGAKIDAIKKAEDRELFKKTMLGIGLDVPKSGVARNLEQAQRIAEEIGFPLIIRASFTLGGVGSAIVYTKEEFMGAVVRGLDASPIHEILLEQSVIGWKEFELEVMRDRADQCVVICSIENLDPMGVHTGDSITVAPAQTLSDPEYQILRDQAFACIRAIGVETGGSNVQFAVDPRSGRTTVIEMNPRVSRSSALASKATGFPIAKMAALLAVGYRLDEIANDITKKTPACFEPVIDYVVTKVPRFAFEKFTEADQTLTTSMKSVGEVMAIGRTFRESLQKALRGLEIGRAGLGADGKSIVPKVDDLVKRGDAASAERAKLLEDVEQKLRVPNCDRIFYVKYALQLGLSVEDIHRLSAIDPWFLHQMAMIWELEKEVRAAGKKISVDLLRRAKRDGFSDVQIAYLTGLSAETVAKKRKKDIPVTFKKVDTCAAEFPADTPYFYSTYETEDESLPLSKSDRIIVLGGGPNRIGQGIEFDYCCVHAAWAIKECGAEAIMVNCNPETVSTDYDTSDQLFFEPLTLEDVVNVVERTKAKGVIPQFGGQTPLNLAKPLLKAGVKILGTSADSIDIAEDRERFGELLKKLKIPHPAHGTARNLKEAEAAAARVGYPVMVRPSYVLGGRAMEVVYDKEQLADYMKRALESGAGLPILLDRFLEDAKEVDVDAVCDGKDVYIAGIMEHIEEAGIHSGDSACVLPPYSLEPKVLADLERHTRAMALALKVKGLINIQYAVQNGTVYVLEANPRASRTVPFVSKATGVPLAKVAAKVMVGKSLKEALAPYAAVMALKKPWYSVKEVVFPWMRFPQVDVVLGPEMRSTGEVMGIDENYGLAFAKAQAAAGSALPKAGKILFSLRERDRKQAVPIAQAFLEMGYGLMATEGTYLYLKEKGLAIEPVKKIAEGRPNVLDVIKNREVVMVINTPHGRRARSDGFHIRRTALVSGVPIFTTYAAARAVADGLKMSRSTRWQARPLQSLYAAALPAAAKVPAHV